MRKKDRKKDREKARELRLKGFSTEIVQTIYGSIQEFFSFENTKWIG